MGHENQTGSRFIKIKCRRSNNNPVLCVVSYVPQVRANGDNVHVWKHWTIYNVHVQKHWTTDNVHVRKHWTTTIESIAAAAVGTGCETLYYGVAHGM